MLYLFGAKKMQTSAKKARFQFAECSFSSAKIRLYPETRKDLGWKSFFEKKIGGSRYVREPPGNIYITHILDVLVIQLEFLSGKLAEVAYFCQLAEDWILLAEWHLFKHVHILHYINPTIKYIHTLCLRVLVEQWLLD